MKKEQLTPAREARLRKIDTAARAAVKMHFNEYDFATGEKHGHKNADGTYEPNKAVLMRLSGYAEGSVNSHELITRDPEFKRRVEYYRWKRTDPEFRKRGMELGESILEDVFDLIYTTLHWEPENVNFKDVLAAGKFMLDAMSTAAKIGPKEKKRINEILDYLTPEQRNAMIAEQRASLNKRLEGLESLEAAHEVADEIEAGVGDKDET